MRRMNIHVIGYSDVGASVRICLLFQARLRSDLYCVEWDVKLYYTIPCLLFLDKMVREKVGRPPGELGVSKSMECDMFPFSALTLFVG